MQVRCRRINGALEGQIRKVGGRSGEIEGGVDQENVAEDTDPFVVSPPAEKGDHFLQEDAVKENAGSFLGDKFAHGFPTGRPGHPLSARPALPYRPAR